MDRTRDGEGDWARLERHSEGGVAHLEGKKGEERQRREENQIERKDRNR